MDLIEFCLSHLAVIMRGADQTDDDHRYFLDLLARYRAGEPIEELRERPPLPAGATPFDMLRF